MIARAIKERKRVIKRRREIDETNVNLLYEHNKQYIVRNNNSNNIITNGTRNDDKLSRGIPMCHTINSFKQRKFNELNRMQSQVCRRELFFCCCCCSLSSFHPRFAFDCDIYVTHKYRCRCSYMFSVVLISQHKTKRWTLIHSPPRFFAGPAIKPTKREQ